ncbi:hypothetical protein BD309DRAFT_97056 [Dichomitus squalens]|nr:hypothetical protein BD309DRAFT_97056 [Dichomitus squalens]
MFAFSPLHSVLILQRDPMTATCWPVRLIRIEGYHRTIPSPCSRHLLAAKTFWLLEGTVRFAPRVCSSSKVPPLPLNSVSPRPQPQPSTDKY